MDAVLRICWKVKETELLKIVEGAFFLFEGSMGDVRF